uniref:G domain-containing protein n=1 Tax=Alexandrium monilatum TaxID=311494 RepID=A0A7S4VLX2_9DINO
MAELPEARPDPERAVCVLGYCGVGKSSLVEKLAGVAGLSSNQAHAFTLCSRYYDSLNGRLRIIDTPGINTTEDLVTANLWVAQAFNFCPLNLLLVCVEAHFRAANVVEQIRQRFEQFLSSDTIARQLAVCVTKTDIEKEWTESELEGLITRKLGGGIGVMFSHKDITGAEVEERILTLTKEPLSLEVTADNFLEYFEVKTSDMAVMRTVAREKAKLNKMVDRFLADFAKLDKKEQDDLIFEFLAFLEREVLEGERRIAEKHELNLDGGSLEACINAGTLAHLRRLMVPKLKEVKLRAIGFLKDVENTDFRACPHCGRVWHLVERCPDTYCGSVPSFGDSDRSFATYNIQWDGDRVTYARKGNAAIQKKSAMKGDGCGKRIVWTEMKAVPPPKDLMEAMPVCLSGMPSLHEDFAEDWHVAFEARVSSMGAVEAGDDGGQGVGGWARNVRRRTT